jgi:tRNA pseudouridine38-40 synthase
MARYQLTLAYDGTDFFGSQRQAKPRTVQGELEHALRELGWTERAIVLSGRTDTGVHATGQVVSFDLNWSHADEELVRALNSKLPKDMAVREVKATHTKFHPRFDATARRYQYKLFCQPLRDPFRERFAWRIFPAINSGALAQTAKLFLGTHDFSAYGSPTTPQGTTVRTVMKAEWTQTREAKDEWRFDVQANAFLYRMVRRLVFVQVAVALGKIPVEAVAGSLAKQAPARTRSVLPSGLAPAHGLTLVEVNY